MASIDPSLLKDASGLSRFTVGGGTPSETYATQFITPSGNYTFIPESVINKGLTVNGNTYFFPFILDKNNLNSFLNQATYVDLSQVPHSGITDLGSSWGDWVTGRTGQSPKGYLVPGDSAIIDSELAYSPTSALGSVKGLATDSSGNLVYATTGGHGSQYMDAKGVHDQWTTYHSLLGDWFGGVGDAVSGAFNDALSAVNSLGPIGTAAISAANPLAGAAVAGANVGTAAAQGNLSAADIAKQAAAAYAGSQVGAQVGAETGSTALGNAAGTTSAGLLSGQNLDTALTSGAFSGAGTGIANAINTPTSSTAADADFIAADAAQLANQGIGQNQIESILSSSGVNSFTAADVAQLAGQGIGQNQSSSILASSSPLDGGSLFGLSNPATSTTATVTPQLATSLLKSLFGGSSGTGTKNMTANTTNLGNLLGGLLGGAGGLMQGSTNTEAMKEYANAITQAGNKAQAQAAFRPVGMTTSFGTSNFTIDPTTGQITNAGYSLSPQLQAAQEGVLGGLRQNLTDAQTQAALGRSYLAQNPQQVASNWLSQQQALLAPSRDTAWARLNQGNYNQGTTGLKVAQGGNLQAANPYASALANAQAQQDAQLAAQAQQQGQQAVKFGQGLLSSAYDPMNAGLTTSKTLEALGQNPYGLSTDLANTVSQRGAVTGRLGLDAASSAAKAMQQANTYNPYASILSGLGTSSTAGNVLGGLLGSTSLGKSLGNWLGGLTGYDYGGTPQGAYGLQDAYMASLPNLNTEQANILNEQNSWFNTPDWTSNVTDPETRRALGLD